LPFWVTTWTSTGPLCMSRTFSSTGIRWSRLWPSMGPDVIEAEFLEQGAARHQAAAYSSTRRTATASGRGSFQRQRLGQTPHAAVGTRRPPAATDAPTAPPPAGQSDMSLSLRITIKRVVAAPALFIAS